MKRRQQYFFIVFLLVLGYWGIRSLFGGNFYTSHDGYTHTARIAQYFMAFTDGQMPPRWAGTLNGGFGSPIFIYSYPLPYIFGSLLHAAGFSFTDAFKVIIGTSFVISGIFMYFFLRELFDDIAAFVGSAFFLLAPYRFLNMYVRGSLSESLAYAALPIALFALVKLAKSNNPIWILSGSLSFSALLLSQYLVAALFLPVLLLFAGLLFIHNKSVRFLIGVVGIILFGFGLSATSFVPIFFERGFIRFAQSISYYASHFVTIWQLIRSPWGYGFSLPGTVNDGMSFQIGLVHIMIVGLSCIFAGFYIFASKNKKNTTLLQFLFLITAYFLFFISIALLLETPITKLLWQRIPLLQTIDLPWRFLGLSVFSASIIAAYVAQQLKFRWLLLPLIILLIYANRNHIRVNQYLNYPDEEFTLYKGTATWVNEYTPVWRSSTKFQELPFRYTKRGKMDITQVISKSNELNLVINSLEETVVRLNIFYFPGWKIYRDGEKLQENHGYAITTVDDGIKDGPDESGLIDVNVPIGKHTIIARFEEMPLRKVGNSISVISFFVLIATYLFLRNQSIPKIT